MFVLPHCPLALLVPKNMSSLSVMNIKITLRKALLALGYPVSRDVSVGLSMLAGIHSMVHTVAKKKDY